MKTLFIKFLVLLPLLSLSQINKKENYTVYLNYPGYTIKADVVSGSKKIQVKQDLVYYWYSSNKIHETKGGYDGKILNGPFTSFYLSGNLKEKGQLKNGLKNGEWILWFENGKIQSVKKWHNGLQTSVYRVYDINGNLALEEHYKNGMLNGKQTFIEDGKIVSIKKFKNGKEILPKEKKEKSKVEENKKTKEGEQPKKKIFSFKKKNKDDSIPDKSAQPAVQKKKNFREKLNALFKKKEKPTEKTKEPAIKKDKNK